MFSLFPHNRFVRLLHSFSVQTRYAITFGILFCIAAAWWLFVLCPKQKSIAHMQQGINALEVHNQLLKQQIIELQKSKSAYEKTEHEHALLIAHFEQKPPNIDGLIMLAQFHGLALKNIAHEEPHETPLMITTSYSVEFMGEYEQILSFLEKLPEACPFIPFSSCEMQKTDSNLLTLKCACSIVGFKDSFFSGGVQHGET